MDYGHAIPKGYKQYIFIDITPDIEWLCDAVYSKDITVVIYDHHAT